MKRFKILIPVYNDWESLQKLLNEIDKVIVDIKNAQFDFMIVNDASTIKLPQIKLSKNIKKIEIFNMKQNRGHARCNAFGIRYLSKKDDFDHLIVMDGDGEDRPEEIKYLVNQALEDNEVSVVAKRVKRSEGPIFQILYEIHKLITLVFAGKQVNFGNYCCLIRKDVITLSQQESLWSSFSGTLKKSIIRLNTINSTRGLRYFGPSKMSLFNLGIHSFSIIAVFKSQVFLRGFILAILIFLFKNLLGSVTFYLILVLIFFMVLIYLNSFRENIEDFVKSEENVDNIKTYTH
ncbi:MAG: glycosyltransferase [Flavobacteriales bacterium TMED235]|nr:MAG: glycosyltransferase [Flavobacteriales bacterium TMED235]